MIKKLKLIKTGNSGTYYIENGEKVDGVHQKITGNPIGIYGNVTKMELPRGYGSAEECPPDDEEEIEEEEQEYEYDDVADMEGR